MKDSEIDYSDIPRLDKTFFKKATMPWPPAKKQLTIRLDEDVLAWLKRHGKGYQTRINRILRVVMESQPGERAAVSFLLIVELFLKGDLSSAPLNALSFRATNRNACTGNGRKGARNLMFHNRRKLS